MNKLLVELGDILIIIGLVINAWGLHKMNKDLLDIQAQIKVNQK